MSEACGHCQSTGVCEHEGVRFSCPRCGNGRFLPDVPEPPAAPVQETQETAVPMDDDGMDPVEAIEIIYAGCQATGAKDIFHKPFAILCKFNELQAEIASLRAELLDLYAEWYASRMEKSAKMAVERLDAAFSRHRALSKSDSAAQTEVKG